MNLPTKITTIRLALIPFMIISYCLETTFSWMFIVTGAIFLFASSTDYVDGYIARKYKMVTSLGKFLDPIADKILVVTALLIAIDSNSYRLGIPYLVLICSIIIIAREFIVSLFRQIAALKNCVLAADNWGKYKTTLTMIALGALLYIPFREEGMGCINKMGGDAFWWIALISLIGATVLTVYSGFNYLYKNKDVLKEKKTKIDMIKDEEIDFPDEMCIPALELCLKEQKCGLIFIQKELKISYARAFKISFWIEAMDFVKIENNKKVLSLTPEDVDAIKNKKKEIDNNLVAAEDNTK